MAATPLKFFASFATFCSKNEKDWNRSKQREQRQIHSHSPATATFSAVVPAGVWQAGEPMKDEALVGCSVAPGFDFADFTLISDNTPVRTQVIRHGLDRFL